MRVFLNLPQVSGITGGIESTRSLTLEQYSHVYHVIRQQVSTASCSSAAGTPVDNQPAVSGAAPLPFDASIILTRWVYRNAIGGKLRSLVSFFRNFTRLTVWRWCREWSLQVHKGRLKLPDDALNLCCDSPFVTVHAWSFVSMHVRSCALVSVGQSFCRFPEQVYV